MKKKKALCEFASLSRDTLAFSPSMSIVRVFLFSRDFATFPRLLFWRLPSARRPSPFLSPLYAVTPPPLSLPSSCLPVCFLRCAAGSGGRDLAIVGLFRGESYLEDGARCYGVSVEV